MNKTKKRRTRQEVLPVKKSTQQDCSLKKSVVLEVSSEKGGGGQGKSIPSRSRETDALAFLLMILPSGPTITRQGSPSRKNGQHQVGRRKEKKKSKRREGRKEGEFRKEEAGGGRVTKRVIASDFSSFTYLPHRIKERVELPFRH
jgi:hypothetical protein